MRQMNVDRRSFLKTATVGLGFSLLPLWAHAKAIPLIKSKNQTLLNLSPELILKEWKGSSQFTGDHEDAAHEIFWDKRGFLQRMGGIPKVSKNYDLVIVGAGIAGLSAAYFTKGKKTLLLEGHAQVGGNSKMERFQDICMGTGAAYVTLPDEGDDIDTFFSKSGLKERFRQESKDQVTVGLKGKFVDNFWSGSTDPENRKSFELVKEKFLSIGQNSYPELPLWGEGDITRAEFDELDQTSMRHWLQREMPDLHPHIEEYLIQYGWSSFGGGLDELSAAQFLNFITSDLQGIQSLPGGNGAIAKAFYQQLIDNRQLEIKSSSFVVNIETNGSDVFVTYLENGVLTTVRCKHCIVAAPKFVSRYLIDQLPVLQDLAMKRTGRRAYLVANVLLKRPVTSAGYDCYTLHGKIPHSDRHDSTARAFSDIAFADWANFDRSGKQALTLFIPQPYDMAQQFLFSPSANEKHQARVTLALENYLAYLKLNPDDIAGIRLARYGHALPLARPGLIANGTLEVGHQSLENIHFAGQCNWANPCFETAFETGRQAALKTF